MTVHGSASKLVSGRQSKMNSTSTLKLNDKLNKPIFDETERASFVDMKEVLDLYGLIDSHENRSNE